MTKDEFEILASSLDYVFAKTYKLTHPHEYCISKDEEIINKIRKLNKYIIENGEIEDFYGKKYNVLFTEDYKYWSIEPWEITDILNRNWDFKNEDGILNKSKTEERKNNE